MVFVKSERRIINSWNEIRVPHFSKIEEIHENARGFVNNVTDLREFVYKVTNPRGFVYKVTNQMQDLPLSHVTMP